MAQPKTPPLSIRPGADLLAKIDTYAEERGLSRHAAVLAMLEHASGEEAAIPADREARVTPVVEIANRTRFTMDDVRGPFVPRLKGDAKKR